MSRDVKWLATHTKSWKKDFKAMQTRIAQHVLEGGLDPYAGWAEGWPKWALDFKERLLLRREGEQRQQAQTSHAPPKVTPSSKRAARNRKRKAYQKAREAMV